MFTRLLTVILCGVFLFFASGEIYAHYPLSFGFIEYVIPFLGISPVVLYLAKKLPSYFTAATEGVCQAVKGEDYGKKIDYIEKFHQDLKKIIRAYAHDRIYVFMDDLDRCHPQKAAELVHAINLMLSDDTPLIILIGMDRDKIAAAIASSFKDSLPYLMALKEGAPKNSELFGIEYGNSFLEKFIQISFNVPVPSEPEIAMMILALGGKNSTIEEAREFLPMEPAPHLPPPAPDETTFPAPPEDFSLDIGREESRGIVSALMSIVEFLDYNPRRAKQALNLIRLYGIISNHTNILYGSRLTSLILAKYVALTLQWPSLLHKIIQEPSLLIDLEKVALHKKNPSDSRPWERDPRLLKLIAKGVMEGETFRPAASLGSANLAPLLRICPRPKPLEPEIEITEDDPENRGPAHPFSLE